MWSPQSWLQWPWHSSPSAPSKPPVAPAAPVSDTGPLPDKYMDAIKKLEGFDPKAFWDFKQYTNGYGTRAKSSGEIITRPVADIRFAAEIGEAAHLVDAKFPGLPRGVRAALVSLTFNSGFAWASAGLGKEVKAGHYDAARSIFLQYDHAGGKVNSNLEARRKTEAAWFADV